MLSLQKLMVIVCGSVLIALGIHLFLIPHLILDGGMIGIGLILNYIYGVKVGSAIILCSIPVFVLAWFYCRNFFFNSLQGLLISSFVINLVEPLRFVILYRVNVSPLSSSIIGGLFIGTGLGLMLRHETSTGGTDLLSHLLSMIIPLNVGFIVFLIDCAVIAAGGLLLASEDMLLLSIVTISTGGVATGLLTLKSRKKEKIPPA